MEALRLSTGQPWILLASAQRARAVPLAVPVRAVEWGATLLGFGITSFFLTNLNLKNILC